ncbi:MAG TPA: limonene-1,2-epoxide hydrolase family protein [Acidimicrobiales bacterium]|jgi:limonene-1,2-epoxide hydrolase
MTDQTPEAEAVVRDFSAAMASLDRERVRPFLAPGVEFRDPGTRATGPDAVLSAFDPVFSGFEAFDLQIVNLAVTGDVVFVERRDIVTIGGKQAVVPAVALFEVVGSRIVRWYDYFDGSEVAALMGAAGGPR